MVRIVYRYGYMQALVAFALETLHDHSPVGSGNDTHPGLYRDSHTVFLNGHVVTDVSGWKPGDEIDISNPAPYARKIETGSGKIGVPAHTYETSVEIIKASYGNQAAIALIYLPVRFGDTEAFQQFSGKLGAGGRRVSIKEKRDWLVHQPVIQIR